MSSVKPPPIPCAECGRDFAAVSAVCPFCGHRRQQGEPQVPPSIDIRKTNGIPAAAAPTPPAAEPVESELLCPRCGAGTDLKMVTARSWEYLDISLSGTRKFLVRTAKLPGYCAHCAKTLARQRLLATVLGAVPLWFLAVVAGFSPEKKFPLLLLLLYALYLLRKLSYLWSDRVVYGLSLEWNLKNRTNVLNPEVARLTFPVGWLHALGRAVFFFVTAFFLALFAAGFAQQ
jgi:hypothetical protein